MDKLLRIFAVGAAAAWLVGYGGYEVAAQSSDGADTEQTAEAEQSDGAEQSAGPEEPRQPEQAEQENRVGGPASTPMQRALERRAYDTQRDP